MQLPRNVLSSNKADKPERYESSSRRFAFGVAFTALLLVVTLVGVEIVAGCFAPSWPQRAMRTVPVTAGNGTNSWGMNDRERSIAKPAGVRFRGVFVGDSFVDLRFNHQTLPEAVENLAQKAGIKGLEAVNLGVVATDPRSYYYRTRDVALSISPDAILLFFFSGNDFIDEGFHDHWLPPLVDESPGGSLLGRIMPRTDWAIVNGFDLSEFFRGNKLIPKERATLASIVAEPQPQRIADIVQYMHKYYFPNLSKERLTEILSRGGDTFWTAFRRRSQDREYLDGWLPAAMVNSELIDNPVKRIKTIADAASLDSEPTIKATLSWLVATKQLADARGIPFRVFVIPPGSVAPDFVDYWKPWPRFFAWYLLCDVRHQRLVKELATVGVPAVDLRPILAGVPGTYRLSDGHWTEKGILIVAHRVLAELAPLTSH
jgi:hypothetical protein